MTGPPSHEMSREALNVIVRMADQGESPVRLGTIQEELGLGHDDAREVMAGLLEGGLIAEEEPSAFVLVGDTPQERERVTVSVPEEDSPTPRDDREAARAMATLMPEATVRLRRGPALKMDDAALGQLVKATLEDLADGETFLMEIE